ncbi:MAG: lysophospholipid acyltransferase family protein [Acidimicrobiales bacterium]
MSAARQRGARAGAAPSHFLTRAPTVPGGVERRPQRPRLGVDFDTAWARRYPVRLARAMLVDDLFAPVVHLCAPPSIYGAEQLEPLAGPVIVAANHASHLDTTLLLTCLPPHLRHRTIVGAAADYFFDRRWKATLWALSLGAIPMERVKVNRRSADLAASLIADGWSLVIFPEGGRTPDGWGQEFKGGAAYLAKRCSAPVVPVHLRGTRAVAAKGSRQVRRGPTEVRFGTALWPSPDEDARRFAARIEAAVALLADEAETDWWSARRRAATGETPAFRGPAASAWRRAWTLPASADPNERRRGGLSSARASGSLSGRLPDRAETETATGTDWPRKRRVP